ncbi:MAG: OmpA family protein [Vicingaceae bacterium]
MRTLLKKGLLIFFISLTSILSGQISLPQFEAPELLDSLNDNAEESMPVPFNNGNGLYFVKTYVDGNLKQRTQGQEVYTAQRVDGEWQAPKNSFDEINDWGNNAVVGVSDDGNRVYVFNSIQSRRKLSRGLAYIEKEEDGSWGKLQKLEVEGLDIGEGYYSFYINPSETTLMISMAPSDTTLDEDLFVSLKQANDTWGAPIHLGNEINTKNYEISPFLAKDNKTLYFSSNGHGGFGASDIFVSYRLDDTWENWTSPKNLGKTINSVGFEAYFSIANEKEVYFASNRDQQYSDLYYTTITKQLIYNPEDDGKEEQEESTPKMNKLVAGEFTIEGMPVENVELEIIDEDGVLIEEVTTDVYGQFTYSKLDPEKVYLVRIKEDDKSQYGGGQVYFIDDEGEKVGKFVKDSQGDFAEKGDSPTKEKVQGIYTYNKLPVARASLVVVDESGFPMDTIYTDDEGKFDYEAVDSTEKYAIIPMETDDKELNEIDLFLADEKGARLETLPVTTETLALRPMKKISKDYDEAEPEKLVYSQFTLKGLPVENVKLEIFDSQGEKVEEVVTDAYGNFSYQKLNPDEVYIIRIAEEDIEDFSGGKVYFVDKEGEKIGRYVQRADSSYATEGMVLNPTLIKGVYLYKQLPAEDVGLGVLDDNGFLLDTVYTDDEGIFEYESLSAEEDYSIVLMETEGVIEEDLDIYLIDEEGQRIESQELKEGLLIRKPQASLIEKNVVYSQLTLKGMPAENIKLEIYDDEGELVDEVVTDEDGLFSYEKLDIQKNYMVKIAEVDIGDFSGTKVYFVDQAGNKKGRYDSGGDETFIEKDTSKKQEIIKGVYANNKKPNQPVKLGIFDESGFLVDSVTTKNDGSFEVEGLDSNEVFSVVLMEADSVDQEDLDLYLTDKEGNKIDAKPIKQGLMVRKPMASLVDKSMIYGQFIYEGLPVENVKLEIYDDEGTLVDEVVTDAYGNFKYTKLDPEKVYFVKLAEEDVDIFGNSKMYFTNDEGTKTGRFVETEKGVFSEKAAIEDQERIIGVFTYKSEPVKKAGIIIVDENGVPIDTFYTDSYGKFEFFMVDEDEEYSLIPMNVENVQLEQIDLYLTNDAGERIRTLQVEKAKIEYLVNNSDSKSELEKKQNKQNPNETDIYYIYFQFNQYALSENDRGILDLVIDVLKNYSSANVELVGHTDNIGSDAVNMRFGEVRAISAMRYLKRHGISEDRISIESKGETMPVASNETSEGRAKNRRVEVSIIQSNLSNQQRTR